MRRRPVFARRVVPLLTVAVLLLSGCMSSRLQKDAFEGHRIAAIAAFPPRPTVENVRLATYGFMFAEPTQYEADQARRLQHLLDAATERVDLAAYMAREALVVGAQQLGATITNDPEAADYVLDLRVYHYGLLMASIETEANFYIDAELLMRDRTTDEVIWKKRLDRFGNNRTRLSSGEMIYLTEEEMAQELQKFAAFAAQNLASALTRNIVDDPS